MLVLSRRTDEAIVIGDGITVRVLGVRGNRVKLGIDAPQNVPVNRLEVSGPSNLPVRAQIAKLALWDERRRNRAA